MDQVIIFGIAAARAFELGARVRAGWDACGEDRYAPFAAYAVRRRRINPRPAGALPSSAKEAGSGAPVGVDGSRVLTTVNTPEGTDVPAAVHNVPGRAARHVKVSI